MIGPIHLPTTSAFDHGIASADTYAATTDFLRERCSRLADDDLGLAVLKKWPGMVGNPTRTLVAWAALTDEITRRDRSLVGIDEVLS